MRRLAALAVPLLALASAGAFGPGALLLMCPDALPGLLAVLGGGALTAAGASGLVGLIAAFCGKNKYKDNARRSSGGYLSLTSERYIYYNQV